MIRTLFIATALLLPATAGAQHGTRSVSPADLVDPFMGTAGDRGQLSPAAAAPFGMVQLAPDTTPANHIGYDRGASQLLGFSQTRAQGVGCKGGGGDLLTSVAYADEAGPVPMDKASERAGAGWYHVAYGRTPIVADLAAGQSASISRFRLSSAGKVLITLDPRHSYAKHRGHTWSGTRGDDVRLALANGTVCDRGVYRLGVAARLLMNRRPLSVPGTLDAAGVLRFEVTARAGDAIEVRVALSSVDPVSARRTLDTELGTTSLEQLTQRTRSTWNAVLSRVQIDMTLGRRKLFYTALFRALQLPARVDDSDGAYRGSDGQLRHVPAGRHRYAGWSLWDNYRTQVPLVALTAPDVGRDIADSLTELFVSGKPQWAGPTEPFLSVRTEHGGITLLDLRRKRLGGEGAAAALPFMARETEEVPHEAPDQRIEQAYDQWAVGELAADLGNHGMAEEYRRRALDYRTMWRSIFLELGADADMVKARGLYQGTLWQYRWAPVFDLPWLRATALSGGRFTADLGHFFDAKLFNMTNEPDIQAPYLFAIAGQPERTDALVATLRDQPIEHWYENARKYDRPILQPSFSLSDGFAEGMDDDGGAMSAWYVWASLGLYPLVPGEPWYLVTLPAARHSSLALGSGRQLTIDVRGVAGATRVKRMTFDGRPLIARRLEHADLVRGGNLVIEVVK